MCGKLSKILTLPSCLHQIKKTQNDVGKGTFLGYKLLQCVARPAFHSFLLCNYVRNSRKSELR